MVVNILTLLVHHRRGYSHGGDTRDSRNRHLGRPLLWVLLVLLVPPTPEGTPLLRPIRPLLTGASTLLLRKRRPRLLFSLPPVSMVHDCQQGDLFRRVGRDGCQRLLPHLDAPHITQPMVTSGERWARLMNSSKFSVTQSTGDVVDRIYPTSLRASQPSNQRGSLSAAPDRQCSYFFNAKRVSTLLASCSFVTERRLVPIVSLFAEFRYRHYTVFVCASDCQLAYNRCINTSKKIAGNINTIT